jgi:hypothetical protein
LTFYRIPYRLQLAKLYSIIDDEQEE